MPTRTQDTYALFRSEYIQHNILLNFVTAYEEETQRLIATDVIGRGVDIPNVTHVINIDTPLKAMWNEKTRQNDLSLGHEEYLQRVGRAGRMGKTGVAITFMPGDHDQVKQYGPSKAKIDETMNPL